ncbi:hypothetical protein [Streptomyces sp. NPDC090026]|uniref:hypothetical protein n=1 Tax=Streptomyces sp. NPDC090026 TaxID=3365923 RepID=UPI00381F8DAE
MIEGLAKAVVEPLAARWRNTALGTSLVLWLAALLVYVLSRPKAAKCTAGARSLPCRIADIETIGPALLLVAGFGTAVSTAFLAAGVAPGLFTLLTADSWRAGPAPVAWAGSLLVRFQTHRRTRLSTFAGAAGGSALAAVRRGARFAELRARYPMDAAWPVSASACGNALAAVAERLDRKLGLDLSVVWGALLTVLPEGQYSRLVAQSSVVLGRCQQLLIAVGGLALAPLFPLRWALAWVLACLLCALAFRHGLVRETIAFAAQVHSVVVAHRISLYAAYGLSAPVNPQDEVRCGQTLTRVLRSFENEAPPTGITYEWPPPPTCGPQPGP